MYNKTEQDGNLPILPNIHDTLKRQGADLLNPQYHLGYQESKYSHFQDIDNARIYQDYNTN